MPTILGANSVSGYNVSNSIRFNSGDNPKLERTLVAATGEKVFSFSTWVKRSSIGGSQSNYLLYGVDGSSNSFNWYFRNDALRLYENTAGSGGAYITTNQLFRDVSAWYHVLLVYNTNESTNTNRVKIYINGSQIAVGDLSVTNWPDEDYTNAEVVKSGNTMKIGASGSSSEVFDGYLAETYFIDGQALAPSDFGEFDDNGVWIPIKYTGTFGNNGMFLEYQQTGTSANASGIGADTSGNTNHFTVTNLAALEITEDTPTNNFATLNPLFRSNFDNDGAYSEGNVQRSFTSANSDRGYGFSTFGVTSGKWYWEVLVSTVARANTGIGDINAVAGFSGVIYDQNPSKGFIVNYNGQIEENATATSYASSLSDGDTVMWALDMDNHRAYYGINGTWQDSGDPASGSTGTGDVTTQISDQSHLNTGEAMFPFCLDASTSGQSNFKWNFGNPFHTISSGNNDGKYGNFEYAVPSGYYALCTKRLAEFG